MGSNFYFNYYLVGIDFVIIFATMNTIIRDLIKAKGISISDFARSIGWTPSKLYRKIKQPKQTTLDDIAVIAKALNVPMCCLINDKDNG